MLQRTEIPQHHLAATADVIRGSKSDTATTARGPAPIKQAMPVTEWRCVSGRSAVLEVGLQGMVEILTTDEKIQLTLNDRVHTSVLAALDAYGFTCAGRICEAPNTPQTAAVALELKRSLREGNEIKALAIPATYAATADSIRGRKFSVVEYTGKSGSMTARLLFETAKLRAEWVAKAYASYFFKEPLADMNIHFRSKAREARALLKAGKVIDLTEIVRPVKPPEKLTSVTENSKEAQVKPQKNQDTPQVITDRYTNAQGVYTSDTAGDRYETIEFLFPKKFKASLEIPVVKGEDGRYRSSLHWQVNEGGMEGGGYLPSTSSPSYSTKKEAVEAIITNLPERIKSDEPLMAFIHDTAKGILSALAAEETKTQPSQLETPTAQEKTIAKTLDKKLEELIALTPYEYQQLQAIEKTGSTYVLDAKDRRYHEALVKQALTEGLTVPDNVMEHYPHLWPDPIDRVVAFMHEAYIKRERLSKGAVEKQPRYGLSLGELWEAVELSWLLWYKNIYKEPLVFHLRLSMMQHFWKNIQPTYAYSDSSKELYRQYSTPCPIAAIVAEYCQMKGKTVFDPSAGNGLLVTGADPKLTHVNEIDATRRQSLEFQGFSTVTAFNAAAPLPENLNFDVVVTNPPYARWEDPVSIKEVIVQRYFHGQRGLVEHMRLEHLMAGLALHTLKDSGKAALVLMGHLTFSYEDGYIRKYRPFFNWLYRHYHVEDIINMNSFKLYNKQGAVERTMLVLINGRKKTPHGVAPRQKEAPGLATMVESFSELWQRVQSHLPLTLDILIAQLKSMLR